MPYIDVNSDSKEFIFILSIQFSLHFWWSKMCGCISKNAKYNVGSLQFESSCYFCFYKLSKFLVQTWPLLLKYREKWVFFGAANESFRDMRHSDMFSANWFKVLRLNGHATHSIFTDDFNGHLVTLGSILGCENDRWSSVSELDFHHVYLISAEIEKRFFNCH